MQIPLKWINELVDLKPIAVTDLIKKLTLGGFEVEEILEIPINDTKTIALEISATANRSDSLSIQGLALEIAALLNCPSKVSKYFIKNDYWLQQLQNFQTLTFSEKDCSSFIGVTIENLNNFQSPKWLQQKLIISGVTPENNLADFQNYIMLETGYPMEVYDLMKIYQIVKLDKSSLFELSVNSQTNKVKFSARNEVDYLLDDSILTINANNIPIGVAGIIGSATTNYDSSTTDLFVEASIFNAAKIRQESRFLGLRTERSSRYEKSLNNTNLIQSLYRFVSLLRIANPYLICKLHSIVQQAPETIVPILLEYKKVKQVLGPIQKLGTKYDYLSPNIITEAFDRLQFKNSYDEVSQQWSVFVPSFRCDDIIQDIDLIEEIGRIYGFNNFLTRLPAIETIGLEDFDYQIRKKLTSCFLNLGLNELIQYSLVNEETYLKNKIALINPLVKDYSNLRSSLLPSLLKAAQENLQKSNSNLEGFEYGHVFLSNSFKNLIEKEYVAGIFGSVPMKSNWSDLSKSISWFEAKGKMEQLFQKLNITIFWKLYQPVREKRILHPYCTAELFTIDGTKLGIFGKISYNIAKDLGISTNLYLFEFDFEIIKQQIQQNKLVTYQEYSLYPKILKDLSFIVSKDIPFDQIEEILYLNGSQVLQEINLLDEYSGESIPLNSTSLCLQLIFQSSNETLKNTKVDMIMNRLGDILTKIFDATIRL